MPPSGNPTSYQIYNGGNSPFIKNVILNMLNAGATRGEGQNSLAPRNLRALLRLPALASCSWISSHPHTLMTTPAVQHLITQHWGWCTCPLWNVSDTRGMEHSGKQTNYETTKAHICTTQSGGMHSPWCSSLCIHRTTLLLPHYKL